MKQIAFCFLPFQTLLAQRDFQQEYFKSHSEIVMEVKDKYVYRIQNISEKEIVAIEKKQWDKVQMLIGCHTETVL